MTSKMDKGIMEKRISRLAFNTNGWIKPSGFYGKSLSKDSYEAQFGFGHEEWLFDVSKLIDGYHYGFLEPVRKHRQTYEGKSFQVWLYSIDSKSKKRFWVGEISKIEVLTKKEADSVLKEYQKRGWYAEMENQVVDAGGSKKAFASWHDIDLFNIRFKPKDIKVNDPYFEIPVHHPLVKQSRYNFIHYSDSFKIESNTDFIFVSSFKKDVPINVELEKRSQFRESKSIEISNFHKVISEKVTVLLRQKYGNMNVTPEHPSGIGGNRIDIVVNSVKEGLIFYEIKTYNSVITSIREAFGQLMEYSFYPQKSNASELIILTQKHPDIEEAKSYIKHIRNKFKIPLFYQWYDIKNNILSEKY